MDAILKGMTPHNLETPSDRKEEISDFHPKNHHLAINTHLGLKKFICKPKPTLYIDFFNFNNV